MKKEVKTYKLADLEVNAGQLEWLPRNPRQWTRQDLDAMAASIKEDPDFIQDRPPLVVPNPDKPGKAVVFAHNLWTSAAKDAKLAKDVQCYEYTPESDADRDTIVRRALKDNGTFGSWDWDILANEWPSDEAADWGVPVWSQSSAQRTMENGGLSSQGGQASDDYNEFLDKFKPKLTTDDCYTPPAVFDVVRKFVDEKVVSLEGKEVVRPFYPGGDYENMKQYPEGCVVIDNPPFSLLSKILRFYNEKGIAFFLFGPHLTLFSAHEIEALTYLPVCAPVEYENGAVVSTGFITNMTPGLKIWIPAGLRSAIREVQRDTEPIDEYLIPPCVITSARLGTIANVKGCELKIMASECQYIKNLDSMDAQGKGLYGGGYILTAEKAEYIEKEKEKEKEKRQHTFPLSEREKAIQDKLTQNTTI